MKNIFLAVENLLFISTTILIFASCSRSTNDSNQAGLKLGAYKYGEIIFYLDSSGAHGLVASQSDQSTSIDWYDGIHITTGAKGSYLGTGSSNTAAIVSAQGRVTMLHPFAKI